VAEMKNLLGKLDEFQAVGGDSARH
jgi:hypothetical protein